LFRHPGCSCRKGFGGDNCQYREEKANTPKVAGILGGLLAGASIAAIIIALRKQRRRAQTKSFGTKTLPPTLDIIRSLGHDREAEYTDVAMVVSDKSSSTHSTYKNYVLDDNIVIRKTYWPSPTYDGPNSIQVYKDVTNDEEIRFSRKTYWPNDVHNDASNPIHIFDDISVRSDVDDSINITNCDDETENDDSIGISSYDLDSQYKPRGRMV
jgi:hypothetical protein